VLPLREAVPGSEVRLIALRLEYRDRDHLYRMGLMENQCVRIVHNDHRGRVMLRLGQDIFLLGRRETPRIQVREILLD
jgi:Fe2+ transport system protein FeoA